MSIAGQSKNRANQQPGQPTGMKTGLGQMGFEQTGGTLRMFGSKKQRDFPIFHISHM
jgi:hypothetical protein